MTRKELVQVLEALRSARTELEALEEDDVHVASGHLMEQLEDAEALLEGEL